LNVKCAALAAIDGPQLILESSDRAGQHLAVHLGARRGQVGTRTQQSQLDRPPLRLSLPFLGRQCTAGRLPPFGFRLLKLNVFALEASCHDYSILRKKGSPGSPGSSGFAAFSWFKVLVVQGSG
jgi:hypothetical protein